MSKIKRIGDVLNGSGVEHKHPQAECFDMLPSQRNDTARYIMVQAEQVVPDYARMAVLVKLWLNSQHD